MPVRVAWKAPKNWRKIREKVLARDDHKCRVCGAGLGRGKRRAHVHHRLGRRGKSANTLGNLLALCATCHAITSLLAGNGKALVEDPRALERAIQLAKEYLDAVST